MAFSRQQHIALLRGGLDFVPESDFRYLPINVRLKLAELEKRNGQVYLPKDEVASLKREIAAEKMSEAAKRNDPDASEYFGKDPEYKPNPVTSDPAELRGRLGTDKYGTRPTIYRTVDENSAVFNRRYNPTGVDYDSQYSGSPQTILGRYTPTIRGDEILISPTADKDDPLADKKNETEPHEYMHRGLIPTNPIRRYLLGTIDGATEALGIGNIFGTKAFPFNQHTYIDEVFKKEAEKKEQEKIEKQKKLIEEIKQKYGDKKRITRVAKAKGDEVSYLQSALDMLTESAPVTEAPPGTFDLGTIEPFNPIMDRYKPNPLDEFAMMMVGPTSKARLAQLANPTDEVFATATRKEILDYIKTIPLKVRLALRADDSIPLRGKYAILDSDKIDFYEDVVNLNKLPKNFKTGDNTLGKIYMEKNNIPSRVDMSDPLVGFKPRPYFEEIVDKKGVEKIKLYFPKTGRLEPYGTQTKYRQKTLTNPSKEQLDKLFKGIKESDLKKELARVQKAERLDVPNATTKDIAEATQLRMGTPYRTSEEISKELLDLQGAEKLDVDLLAKLRKEFNL